MGGAAGTPDEPAPAWESPFARAAARVGLALWIAPSAVLCLAASALALRDGIAWYWGAALAAAYISAAVPIVHARTERHFVALLDDFAPHVASDRKDFATWLVKTRREAFSFRSVTLWAAVAGFGVVAIYSWTLMLPADASWDFRVVTAAWWLYVALVGGVAVHFLGVIAMAQRHVAQTELNAGFLENHDRLIQRLTRYSMGLALVVIFSYLAGFVAIWTTAPLRESVVVNAFLIGLSAYPLLSVLWSAWHIHTIQERLKTSHVAAINAHVRRAHREVEEKPTQENVARLHDLVKIQREVERQHTWPFSFQATATFSISLATVAGQVLASVRILG